MATEVLTIDGSFGEGGGQILRSSLALSMITQTPIRIENIRAGRKKPGLMKQHLTCVQAAKRVCAAEVDGDHIGSKRLDFTPSEVMAGNYLFNIGTAGSTTLVLQTVLPALMLQAHPSHVTIRGGTHNMKAPTFDFLAKCFLPQLKKLGPDVELTMTRPGFFPAGGGEIQAMIRPVEKLKTLFLKERGQIISRRAIASVSKLPVSIAERELKVISNRLQWPEQWLEVEEVENAMGPGNVLRLEIESKYGTEVITSFGEINKPAEHVAKDAADEYQNYMNSNAPVGKHLADQIMLPLAIAAHQASSAGTGWTGGLGSDASGASGASGVSGGESSYMISKNSGHTQTHAELVSQFLNCQVRVEAIDKKSRACMVTVSKK